MDLQVQTIPRTAGGCKRRCPKDLGAPAAPVKTRQGSHGCQGLGPCQVFGTNETFVKKFRISNGNSIIKSETKSVSVKKERRKKL